MPRIEEITVKCKHCGWSKSFEDYVGNVGDVKGKIAKHNLENHEKGSYHEKIKYYDDGTKRTSVTDRRKKTSYAECPYCDESIEMTFKGKVVESTTKTGSGDQLQGSCKNGHTFFIRTKSV